MAKQKKKRSKIYRGKDAKITRPQIVKVEAANRGKIGQWWFERKRIIRPVLIAGIVAIIVIVLLFELIRLIF